MTFNGSNGNHPYLHPACNYHTEQLCIMDKIATKEKRDSGYSCADCKSFKLINKIQKEGKCKLKDNKAVKEYNICNHHSCKGD